MPDPVGSRALIDRTTLSEADAAMHGSPRIKVQISTALRLGLPNVLRALTYKLCKRAGVYEWILPQAPVRPLLLTFSASSFSQAREIDPSVVFEADELLRGNANYFSAHSFQVGNPPDWSLNPFVRTRHPHPILHWSRIADFSADVGDIKAVWELSRFSWAPVFARAFLASGDAVYLSALQSWMEDWWQHNPPNTGPNWMCAQETSIRLINTVMAMYILGEDKSTAPALLEFVKAHCRRIDATTYYAIAQDNNHATSEAAGLFVGGTWLALFGADSLKSKGHDWARKGRNLLERAVCRLVSPDGSFSQHSLTYHRVLLETLNIAELWRRHSNQSPFVPEFYARAAAATQWLATMIDPSTGNGPNLGANDGAHPYRFDTSCYRDFRPCLQLASHLFTPGTALAPGPWDEAAKLLKIAIEPVSKFWPNDAPSRVFADGGYVVMRNSTACAVLRAPTARFRPAHADVLHLDVWCNGTNLLRDGGTYTYADGCEVSQELSSVIGHNTIQFDGRDQMPKLSRFLYGSWIKVKGDSAITCSTDGQKWSGMYLDPWGVRHKRTVTLGAKQLSVLDEVEGFTSLAALRWRIPPGDWTLNGTECISTLARIRVESTVPFRSISIVQGWESLHYLQRSAIPVLQVEIDQSPVVLHTTVTFS